MEPVSTARANKRLVQIGGIGGVIGGVASLVLTNAFGGLGCIAEPGFEGLATHQANMAKFLAQFSQNPAPLGEAAFLSIVMLAAIPMFLALYALLKERSPSYALIGGVFGILWAVSLLIFLVMRYETLAASAWLYSTAVPGDQGMVVAAAEATFFSVYGLFYIGGIFGSIGFIATGAAMLGTPSFRKGYGLMAVIFGILFGVGTVDITYFAASNPQAPNPFFLIFGLIFWVWLIVVGQKVFRLSRTM